MPPSWRLWVKWLVVLQAFNSSTSERGLYEADAVCAADLKLRSAVGSACMRLHLRSLYEAVPLMCINTLQTLCYRSSASMRLYYHVSHSAIWCYCADYYGLSCTDTRRISAVGVYRVTSNL